MSGLEKKWKKEDDERKGQMEDVLSGMRPLIVKRDGFGGITLFPEGDKLFTHEIDRMASEEKLRGRIHDYFRKMNPKYLAEYIALRKESEELHKKKVRFNNKVFKNGLKIIEEAD
jgi:hypothetical protein